MYGLAPVGRVVLNSNGHGDMGPELAGCADDPPGRLTRIRPLGRRCRAGSVGDVGCCACVVLDASGSPMIPALIVGVLVVVLLAIG